MSYQDQLSFWVIYRRLPNLQRQFLDRFRRRNQAEEYLKVMRGIQPRSEFKIVYEVYEVGQDDDRSSAFCRILPSDRRVWQMGIESVCFEIDAVEISSVDRSIASLN